MDYHLYGKKKIIKQRLYDKYISIQIYVRLSCYNICVDEAMRMKLRWPTRKNIIQMVVKGLTYHYKDLNKQVIHRDLKASNIFLDQNMNAKIFDFGLAKFLNLNETEHRQKHWMGHSKNTLYFSRFTWISIKVGYTDIEQHGSFTCL